MLHLLVALLYTGFLLTSTSQGLSEDPEPDDEFTEEDKIISCPMTISIFGGGTVSYSEEGKVGSILTYHCPPGHYPYPTISRFCQAIGQWSAMTSPVGQRVKNASCRKITCPPQLEFENGDFQPHKGSFQEGETLHFMCHSGYTLRGSPVRNCTADGKWTGTTPICDDGTSDCPNPGIPTGATKTGSHYRINDKVQYRCQTGLLLFGSSERLCLESLEWSGSQPYCYSQFTFHSPEDVISSFGASLSAVMEVSSDDKKPQKKQFGRTIKIEKDGKLNIYIMLDTSGSITRKDFEEAKSTVIQLIEKLESYDVVLNYEVISYASKAIEIVSLQYPEQSSDVESVLYLLTNFKHTDHNETGTNLYAALDKAYNMMVLQRAQQADQFQKTRHVFIILTDGKSNTGGNPVLVLKKIEYLLGIHSEPSRQDYLDVYVFGIGPGADRPQLQSIASSKDKEQHVFLLKDIKDLKVVFDQIITDTNANMCGISRERDMDRESGNRTHPWHVEVKVTSASHRDNCKGSILTNSWILTAAHCFIEHHVNRPETVTVIYGARSSKAKNLLIHPKYNIAGLRSKNITDFYDYDIALIQLENNITISEDARPICLPCTKDATRALRNPQGTSCEEHEKEFFQLEEIPAFFISKQIIDKKEVTNKKSVFIKQRHKKLSCDTAAKDAQGYEKVTEVSEVVTDRFLCTGGSQQYKESITCKGDSGGSLFVQKKRRFFQLGVISWGTVNDCKQRDEPPSGARDFHINIFKVLPWLKAHLAKDLEFTDLPAHS
ncbi:complement factor B isoform X2 [Polypterus senegalus]|uniref:complement factor B isoform X2 n=1 Tax=Polypterus senegalus TaxID=55291 RepID=UPI001963E2CE|nr:complement factor B isoform X2 [Polypterus senegalus]